jgi:hypothetical protein
MCSGLSGVNTRKKQTEIFSNGGRAHIESIYAGKWELWHLRLLSIAADQYTEEDKDGLSMPE